MAARRLHRALGAAVVATALGATLMPAGPADAHHAGVPGPVNAGNTYKWGYAKVNDDFRGPLDRHRWHVTGRGHAEDRFGMLTLQTRTHRSLSVTEQTAGHRVGRWEIRIRSRQYTAGHRRYSVRTELVPAGGRPSHCGAQNIALETYRQHGSSATHYIRNRPDRAFVAHRGLRFRDDQWHTFAVEVTRKHISWFVDAHVVSTERRRDALSGVPLALRFTMAAAGRHRMNRSWMQMDWARYWTLERPNKRSIKAPAPRPDRYAGAC